MPFLPGLAVVFVGIVGGDNHRVEQQVQLLLQEQDVKASATPAAIVHKLASHADGSRDIVKKLHVDGVIGGELVASRGHLTLRIAIYDRDGGLKSLAEIPLSGRQLTRAELAVLNENLGDEVTALSARATAATVRRAKS